MKRILVTRKLLKTSEEYALKIFDARLNEEDKLLLREEISRIIQRLNALGFAS